MFDLGKSRGVRKRYEPIGSYGGTGILEGPGTATFSMYAGKSFKLNEHVGLRTRFHIRKRGNPNMNIGGNSFGQIAPSQLTQQAGRRTIQNDAVFAILSGDWHSIAD